MDRTTRRVQVLLRIALAFAFLYPPVDVLFRPDAWLGFFPPFLLANLPSMVLLLCWGAVQTVIGLWILSGKRIVLPSLCAALMLCVIVLFNIAAFEIVFRDVSLAIVAVALARQSRRAGRR